VDFNNDGLVDPIVGEYGVKTGTPTGKVKYFQRNKNGGLDRAVNLKCGDKEITNRYTSPCIVDWNEDGKLDLILGSNNKVPQIFINVGTKEAYKFSSFSLLSTKNGKPITINHGRQQIRVCDLDGDGRKDVVTCGWNGNQSGGERFFLYRNVGTNAKPEFSSFTILKHVGGKDVVTRKTHCNARFDLFDVNGDGVLDLVFADYRDGYENPIKICLGTSGK
jgi:hypothetical protein